MNTPEAQDTASPSANIMPNHLQNATDDATLRSVAHALETLSGAALDGTSSVASIALDMVRAATGATEVVLIERSGDDWAPQNVVSESTGRLLQTATADILREDTRTLCGTYGCFIPLAPGSEGIFVPRFAPTDSQLQMLKPLSAAFILAAAAANRGHAVTAALDEISGLQSVARETLSARELGQVLSCATHETLRLLSANICGVFLREGDEVVMKSCVGNLRTETSQLRMKKGRGVAGRVFETGQPCRIDEYVRSDSISQDYVELARLEQAYSALAAPLKVHDEVVGVLEVWRRRKSMFSDRDVRIIVALANLLAIAIENARLNEAQQTAVEQLAGANLQLQQQNSVFGLSAEIQQAMLQTLLAEEGLDGIAKVIGRYACAEVAILTDDLQSMTGTAVASTITSVFPTIGKLIRESHEAHQNRHACVDGRWIRLQPILVSGEIVGWVCIVATAPPHDICEMALSAGAISCALSYLENRAAMQARAEVGGEILWDLLEGLPKVRLAAVGRAKGLRIELSGPHRVLHCSLEQLDELDGAEGWSASTAERYRRIAIEGCSRGLEACDLKLFSTRGNLLVALIAGKEAEELRHTLINIRDKVAVSISGFNPNWGVSSISGAAGDYRMAHREAAIALLASAKFGATSIAISEELGVLGLLLSIRNDGDVTGVVGAVLGEVVEHDRKHNHVLARTLRSYFDLDCSLQATALRLHVHQKTVRYRLTQFEQLSGMDLRRHENRMMVDLALRMHLIQCELPRAAMVSATN